MPLFTAIITMPENAATSSLAYAGQLFGDLWVLIAIGVGVPLAFYVINGAMGLVRRRTKA